MATTNPTTMSREGPITLSNGRARDGQSAPRFAMARGQERMTYSCSRMTVDSSSEDPEVANMSLNQMGRSLLP
jgi:hypothetical protein